VNTSTTTADLNLANNVSLKTSVVYAVPSITTQPTNQVTTIGGSANFYVTATGSTPLSYQWTLNGAGVLGATGATLSLTNVQSAQVGTYAVVVTNAAGSATSSSASLQLLVPPLIGSITVVGTKISVPVSSVVGSSYQLEYKTALTDSSWTAASSWEPGTGGVLVLQDTNALGTVRFYRIGVQ
jgi:hypothetical protein